MFGVNFIWIACAGVATFFFFKRRLENDIRENVMKDWTPYSNERSDNQWPPPGAIISSDGQTFQFPTSSGITGTFTTTRQVYPTGHKE